MEAGRWDREEGRWRKGGGGREGGGREVEEGRWRKGGRGREVEEGR